ncbi:MAG: hypothetical protein AB4038_13540 [Prochloraceae cyanobacterium]
MLIIVLPLVKYAMSSDKQDNNSKYKVEYVTPKYSKLRLSGEALRKLNQEEPLVATLKVSQEGYVPSGVEVRTWIAPSIFTANIPHEVLDRLEQDPCVVAIEPVYNLRSH